MRGNISQFIAFGLMLLSSSIVYSQQMSVDDLLSKVGTTCLSAKKAEDLDSLAKKLAEVPNTQKNLQNQRAVYQATQLVEQWQKYLEKYNLHKKKEVQKILQNLLEREDWLMLMPRSAVLERYFESDKSYTWNGYVKPPSDTQNAMDDLNWLRDALGNDELYQNELVTLDHLKKILPTLDNPENIAENERDCQPSKKDLNPIALLKLRMLTHILPSYLRLTNLYKTAVDNKDELATTYLKNALQCAEEQKDLVSYWRILTYHRALEYSDRKNENQTTINSLPPDNPRILTQSTKFPHALMPEFSWMWMEPNAMISSQHPFILERPRWLEECTAGINLCLYGSQLEAKNENEDAAWCYRYALCFIIPPIASDYATERLAFIQKNFPDEYANSRLPRNPARFRVLPIYQGNSGRDRMPAAPMMDQEKIGDIGKLWTRY